ncbi:MAG: hypothetical protein ACK42Z_09940, partial [Candidatus Kapaibacteriota bacterium]
SADLTYTLPASLTPGSTVAAGILQTDASGNLSWLDPSALGSGNAWQLSGNSITSAWNGTTGSFLGTTNTQPLVIATTNTTSPQPVQFWTSNTERMRITESGLVGIGTSAPYYTLDVQTSTDYGGVRVQGTQNVQLVLQATQNYIAQYVFYQGSVARFINSVAADGSYWAIGRFDNSGSFVDLPFTVSRTSGYVGIGTASPSEKLHIDGNLYLAGALMPNGSAGTSGQILVSQGAGNPPQWTDLSSVAWRTTGNSGLNEATNFIGTTDNVGFKIRTNNSDRVIVTSTGNVGIGTNSPNSTFSVEGSISSKVDIVTSNVSLDATHHTVLVNSTSGVTITLPTPSSSNVGRTYVIKNINTGIATISGSIEGSSTLVIRQRESVELISNGSTW